MALKDWKKLKSVDGTTIYWKKGMDYLYLEKRDKKTHPWAFTSKDKSLKYIISLNGATRKFFNTKQQALKYAEEYMRKN
jgi:hypothetical protein